MPSTACLYFIFTSRQVKKKNSSRNSQSSSNPSDKSDFGFITYSICSRILAVSLLGMTSLYKHRDVLYWPLSRKYCRITLRFHRSSRDTFFPIDEHLQKRGWRCRNLVTMPCAHTRESTVNNPTLSGVHNLKLFCIFRESDFRFQSILFCSKKSCHFHAVDIMV